MLLLVCGEVGGQCGEMAGERPGTGSATCRSKRCTRVTRRPARLDSRHRPPGARPPTGRRHRGRRGGRRQPRGSVRSPCQKGSLVPPEKFLDRPPAPYGGRNVVGCADRPRPTSTGRRPGRPFGLRAGHPGRRVAGVRSPDLAGAGRRRRPGRLPACAAGPPPLPGRLECPHLASRHRPPHGHRLRARRGAPTPPAHPHAPGRGHPGHRRRRGPHRLGGHARPRPAQRLRPDPGGGLFLRGGGGDLRLPGRHHPLAGGAGTRRPRRRPPAGRGDAGLRRGLARHGGAVRSWPRPRPAPTTSRASPPRTTSPPSTACRRRRRASPWRWSRRAAASSSPTPTKRTSWCSATRTSPICASAPTACSRTSAPPPPT